MQQTLFSLTPQLPPGFVYQEEFITRDEERFLLSRVATLDYEHLEMHGRQSKRRIAGFGMQYSFLTGLLTPGRPIPHFFSSLIEKVAKWTKRDPHDFVEVLVTEYQPGAVIGWHSDAYPFGTIVGVSLLSTCRFKLRTTPRENRKNIDFDVAARSAYIMDHESRWQWQHSIPPTKNLRYSITLRTLREIS